MKGEENQGERVHQDQESVQHGLRVNSIIMSSDWSPVHDIVYHSFSSTSLVECCVLHMHAILTNHYPQDWYISCHFFFFFAVCLMKPVMGKTLH